MKKQKNFVILATLLVFLFGYAEAGPQKSTTQLKPKSGYGVELGALGAYAFSDSSRQDTLLLKSYLLARGEVVFEPTDPNSQSTTYLLSGAFRTLFDSERDHDFSIRQLTGSAIHENYILDLGFQEVTWGNTFGIRLFDVVNPRDYREPFGEDLRGARIPVFALSSEFLLETISLHFVVTPIPHNNKLAKRGTFFDVLPSTSTGLESRSFRRFDWDEYGGDAEFGGRLTHFFKSGVEVALTYYSYWNRNVVFQLEGTNVLRPVQNRMQTLGFSFNKDFEKLLLRADFAYHMEIPVQYIAFGTTQKETLIQTILGSDLKLDKGWTLGLQLHSDSYEEDELYWTSARLEKEFWQKKLKAELIFFQGLSNHDRWIQPKLSWNVNDRLQSSLSADVVWGSPSEVHSYFGSLSQKDRVQTTVSYKF